jgi:CRP/FNR family transcriptional regulator
MDTHAPDEESRDRARLLTGYPALAGLAPARRTALLSGARWVTVPDGAVLFDEYEPCRAYPLVLSGAVRVLKASDRGRELPLYRVGAGETCVISSSCLLGARPYPARGVAEGETRLVLLASAAFEEALGDPVFRRFVFELLAERIATLMALVDAVAFQRLDQRLATLLLERGPVLRVTHQQLADELGSVREIVSRILRGFSEAGRVRLGRERIEVLDAAALREVSGAP